MDVLTALFGQRDATYRTAAGFSDSPHLFYSGYKPNGEWFLLYQIGFGGVPARPKGDGPDCHCLFPAIKSIPTENIELYFPVIIEANEAVPDSGGAGFYRGGNAQRTLYRFLNQGEVSLHDDRWFTKPWGVNGGSCGKRSSKALYINATWGTDHEEKIILPSKADHVKVKPGDVLEWVTWGGGGLGDPLTRPVETVALEVHQRLVTEQGARENYGVVVNMDDFSVDTDATKILRAGMAEARPAGWADVVYNRGGSLEELQKSCLEETALEPPVPQWLNDPYGPHTGLSYVQDWYRKMRQAGGWQINDSFKI